MSESYPVLWFFLTTLPQAFIGAMLIMASIVIVSAAIVLLSNTDFIRRYWDKEPEQYDLFNTHMELQIMHLKDIVKANAKRENQV